MPRSILILFVAPSVSRKLNRIYRKKNKPTNVLSFVYDTAYAEIFITPVVVKIEAALSGETLEYALVKVIIHGIIHCSGKDHEISMTEERAFESLERKLFERAYGAERRAYRHSKR
jgi:probable rRNA maturation factor